MTIRFRLTLVYSAILALTLIGFSLASYITVARDGLNRLEATLASKAIRISQDPDFQIDSIAELAHLFAGPEIYVQTRNGDAEIIDRSPNLAEQNLPLNWPNPDRTSTQPWVDTAEIVGERRLIYNLPLNLTDSPGAVLQISNSLTDRDRLLSNLLRVLIVGNVLVIAAAFGTGWWVASLGLKPISRLAGGVAEIGKRRDFAQRLLYSGADDEIGQLAGAFDQMLAELEDAHQQTEEALQQQQRFVADASHELRTPLTTVRGNLELLRREPPITSEDRLEVLSDLVDETDRLIRLVNDLLLLARADAKPPNWQAEILIQPVLDSVERQMKNIAPDRQIQFKPIGNAGQPIAVLGNEDALKQLLLILLDNAVKHTPTQAPIWVEGSIQADQIELCISDGGAGISPEKLARIFDRFYVIDSARSQNSTGLGLAIAKTLVEGQNGQLQVVSHVDQGTTFKVLLPCP